MFGFLKSILKTKSCPLCLHAHQGDRQLCEDCIEALPWCNVATACKQCARPLESETAEICGQCVQTPLKLDQCYALFLYQDACVQAINAFKFKKKLLYARVMGELIALWLDRHPQLKANLPKTVIPVPLHKRRLLSRGFNQAVELARFMKPHGFKIDFSSVKRVKKTSPQTLLAPKARRQNLKKAFKVIKKIETEQVLILDDVLTTGSTASSLSETLKQSGVNQVEMLCLCRAV